MQPFTRTKHNFIPLNVTSTPYFVVWSYIVHCKQVGDEYVLGGSSHISYNPNISTESPCM